MCVDEATEEVGKVVDILLGGDGFELKLLRGEHPAFYLVGQVDVALSHYVLDVRLELDHQALLVGCGWWLDVLWIGRRGFLFLLLDGLADEDLVDLLALALHVLLECPYLFLEDLLF